MKRSSIRTLVLGINCCCFLVLLLASPPQKNPETTLTPQPTAQPEAKEKHRDQYPTQTQTQTRTQPRPHVSLPAGPVVWEGTDHRGYYRGEVSTEPLRTLTENIGLVDTTQAEYDTEGRVMYAFTSLYVSEANLNIIRSRFPCPPGSNCWGQTLWAASGLRFDTQFLEIVWLDKKCLIRAHQREYFTESHIHEDCVHAY